MNTDHSTLLLTAWLLGATTISLPQIVFGDSVTVLPIVNEVFFLNIEDGYFGCQVNESADVLQLFKISKLCDGQPECFVGSDEDHAELKCTNDCTELAGLDCKNGACLESQCYCNDGYGGIACELPDENECKLRPCDIFAHCTNTIGSFFCTCFPGYEGDGFHCKDIDECSIPPLKERCKLNEECYNLPAHYICKCLPGYVDDGDAGCKDINECDKSDACGANANCFNLPGNHTCSCQKGYTGDPYDKCVDIDECLDRDICHSGASCVNLPGTHSCNCRVGFTGNPSADGCIDINECSLPNSCPVNSVCENRIGSFSCTCPPGLEYRNQTCVDINECDEDGICGNNAHCINREGTFSCVCGSNQPSLGRGAVECRGKPCNFDGEYLPRHCSCPQNSVFDKSGFCIPCDEANGFRPNVGGQCVCNSTEITDIGGPAGCFCKKENLHVGYGDRCGSKSCTSDSDCPSHKTCLNTTRNCGNPCESKICGTNAYCHVENHHASCLCPQWLSGNGDIACSVRPGRTDFPRPELTVNCLADSIQVDIAMSNFLDATPSAYPSSELFYVKGYSKENDCRKLVENFVEPVDFRVKFGTCGLTHADGEASFILVVQKHPRLVTYTAQAYNIKCVYLVGEKTVKIGLNISALTTAGTISNTGPPPTCFMRVTTATGKEVNSAEIGASLMLRVHVQPSNIYTGFARNCVAKTTEGDDEIEYTVTDENGCATDPGIFGNWEIIPDTRDTQLLNAHFNAFKFPTSGGIKFQCDIRVCFGTCAAVNCNNQPTFGRRKREVLKRHVFNSNSSMIPGRLKEEITLQSNIILTIDNREAHMYNPIKAPKILKKEVCMSATGFLVTIVATALLTLVTATITVSCWIAVLRRRAHSGSPLIHPMRFPSSSLSSSSSFSSIYTTRKLLLQSPPD